MATDTLTPDLRGERKRKQHRKDYERKKAEVRELLKQMPPIECACGCGSLIPPLTTQGKPRQYAAHHSPRVARTSTTQKAAAKLAGPALSQKPPCASEDPEIFWDDTLVGLARAICAPCPVRAQCLQWALEQRETAGVWGGLSASERVQLRRGTAPQPNPDVVQAERIEAIKWLTARGDSAESIARRLDISARTVTRWRARLKETS